MKTFTSQAPMPQEIRELSQNKKHELVIGLLKGSDSEASKLTKSASLTQKLLYLINDNHIGEKND